MKFFTDSIEAPAEEPEPDDEFSFEIITDEEIANLTSAFSVSLSMTSSPSSASISSQGSTCSSSGSISSDGSGSSSGSTGYGSTRSVTLMSEDELTSSVRIWYLIQVKGHYHDEDEMEGHTLGTMEHSSMKRTGWFFNLLHLHEKMRQNSADKNRFNINSIPDATRQQLKHMYVY